MKKVLIFGNSSSLSKALIDSFTSDIYFASISWNAFQDLVRDPSSRLSKRLKAFKPDIVANFCSDFEGNLYSGNYFKEKSAPKYHNSYVALAGLAIAERLSCARYIYVSSIGAAANFQHSSYLASKFEANSMLLQERVRSVGCIEIVNIPGIIGKSREISKHQKFLLKTLDAVQNGEVLALPRFKDPVRHYLHVSDFVAGFLRILETSHMPQSYSLNAAQLTRMSEIVSIVENVFGRSIDCCKVLDDDLFFDVNSDPSNDLSLFVDWNPKRTLEMGLIEMANSHD